MTQMKSPQEPVQMTQMTCLTDLSHRIAMSNGSQTAKFEKKGATDRRACVFHVLLGQNIFSTATLIWRISLPVVGSSPLTILCQADVGWQKHA